MGLLVECPQCRYRNSAKASTCKKCGLDLRKAKGKTYWIEYYDLHHKRRRERIGPNRQIAEMRLAEVKRLMVEERFVPEKRRGMQRFTDFWETRYWPYVQQVNSPGWLRRKEHIYHQHLKPFFSRYRLREISRQLIEDFRQKRLEEGASPAEVNREVAVLRHCLNYAVKLEVLSVNPASNLGALPEREDVWYFLSREEAKRLLEALNPTVRPIFEFALATGLRISNVLNLKWSQVKLQERKLVIPASEAKSKKELVLPISDWALKILQQQVSKTEHHEYVFARKDGRPYRYLYGSFKNALKRAGLPETIRIHDLRHTFASWAVQAGVDFRILKELLGHRTLEMALRYTHLDHRTLLEHVNRVRLEHE